MSASTPLAVTWAGHATALIELDGVRLLTDPVLRERVGPLRRIAAPVSPQLSERIDAVMLSHLHADHADLARCAGSPGATVVLAPRGRGRWLARHGVRNVEELGCGEEAQVGRVRVVATPARHDARRRPLGVRADPIGFIARGSQGAVLRWRHGSVRRDVRARRLGRPRAAADRRLGTDAGARAPRSRAGGAGRRPNRAAPGRADPLGHASRSDGRRRARATRSDPRGSSPS